jgi:hypothetical protein
MESGQQFFHIVGAEIAEAKVLEIDKQDVVPEGFARAEEIRDQLIEEIRFAGPAGADDGEDRPGGGGEVWQGSLAGSQGRELSPADPLGDNSRENVSIHDCLPQ